MKKNILLIIVIALVVFVLGLSMVLFLGFMLNRSRPASMEEVPALELIATNTVDLAPAEPEGPDQEEAPTKEVASPTPTLAPTLEITPTPTFTPTPEPLDRCQLFDPSATTLTLHDIPLYTTDLTFFLEFAHPVPGLEEQVEGDDDEWVYTAVLGGRATEPCTFRDYPHRLYCKLMEFPSTWWGTVQVLEVFVTGCGDPIFTHDRVSILKPACESTMVKDACQWTGGKYKCTGSDCTCNCP